VHSEGRTCYAGNVRSWTPWRAALWGLYSDRRQRFSPGLLPAWRWRAGVSVV